MMPSEKGRTEREAPGGFKTLQEALDPSPNQADFGLLLSRKGGTMLIESDGSIRMSSEVGQVAFGAMTSSQLIRIGKALRAA